MGKDREWTGKRQGGIAEGHGNEKYSGKEEESGEGMLSFHSASQRLEPLRELDPLRM